MLKNQNGDEEVNSKEIYFIDILDIGDTTLF